MAERDVGSTFIMPHSQLYRPDRRFASSLAPAPLPAHASHAPLAPACLRPRPLRHLSTNSASGIDHAIPRTPVHAHARLRPFARPPTPARPRPPTPPTPANARLTPAPLRHPPTARHSPPRPPTRPRPPTPPRPRTPAHPAQRPLTPAHRRHCPPRPHRPGRQRPPRAPTRPHRPPTRPPVKPKVYAHPRPPTYLRPHPPLVPAHARRTPLANVVPPAHDARPPPPFPGESFFARSLCETARHGPPRDAYRAVFSGASAAARRSHRPSATPPSPQLLRRRVNGEGSRRAAPAAPFTSTKPPPQAGDFAPRARAFLRRRLAPSPVATARDADAVADAFLVRLRHGATARRHDLGSDFARSPAEQSDSFKGDGT
ncbi:Protein of unknown function [Gryllus bimaculatus]|nr:Protein of unknown function [Gryllus bimaculatus]